MSLQDSINKLNEFDVNDIDFDKIGVWPLPAKIAVCTLLVVIVIALTYYLKISDLNMQLASVEAKEKTLRQTFQTKSFEAANLDAYKAQMEEMKVTFDSLLSRLPAKTEVPGLLEDIGTRGSESGLTINSVAIQPDVVAEYYIEVPIAIDVKGGYHDMGGFVSGVAGMPRIVTLHDFTISSLKDDRGLNMKIAAKTYRYKTQEQDGGSTAVRAGGQIK
ncbi:type IV pilus inner membrane component PilO [Cellvibrio japonicus]|uniref:PilO n=1 Tax=Cellvibrio japonicus (strain Ueda107) TaxID=498211 RepID=B3PI75_CELJU|nr:type 4a pilus biogenesis protein PilO [Cellvibrio japonicus]ACE85997.1 pilO [Cellvibrio japonicus Ueda107]QEI11120.1 type 4a pilus biogenesis protein PilO [Cellvibrio japonicus]QEI14694.1 type 4a pilus biogenesis protein PilO [Cellvibrio japonicus]QEI18274.1 type 4a pilus biogenesis protein PilO [Cellvibrio japonicus]